MKFPIMYKKQVRFETNSLHYATVISENHKVSFHISFRDSVITSVWPVYNFDAIVFKCSKNIVFFDFD